jgi:hypothetical protein
MLWGGEEQRALPFDLLQSRDTNEREVLLLVPEPMLLIRKLFPPAGTIAKGRRDEEEPCPPLLVLVVEEGLNDAACGIVINVDADTEKMC